jgi:transposase
MTRAAPSFPLHRTAQRPWRPMTDAEWGSLSALLRRATGRPPANARRTWDGIFWVACSSGPWRDMPAEFGRPDTAHRALRRAAQARILHLVLLRASPHPAWADDPLRRIGWFIVRAFRRAFRVAPAAIGFPRHLGLADALPCHPSKLPRPGLSETAIAVSRAILKAPGGLTRGTAAVLNALRRLAFGDPRGWRTTD